MKKLLRRMLVPLLLIVPLAGCTPGMLCIGPDLCLVPGPDTTP